MSDLDDDKTEALGTGRGINRGPDAQSDPITNPDGIYSGMTRRNAATDGAHVTMQGRPKDMRFVGRLTYKDIASRKSTS